MAKGHKHINRRVSIPAFTRFIDKIKTTSYCWIWTGAVGRGGYGNFCIETRYENLTYINAHKAAYIFFKGSVPEEMVVMHTCDNTLCVNPEHLSLGSQKDNLNDMRAKKRDRWSKLKRHE